MRPPGNGPSRSYHRRPAPSTSASTGEVVDDSSTNTGIAFKRTVDGQVLTFSAANSANLVLVDDATGSWWGKSDGRALIGDMKGTSLEFATSFISAWYGWSAYHPQTALYTD